MPIGSQSFVRWLFFFLKPYWKIFATFSVFRMIRFTIVAMLPLIVGLAINAFEAGWAFEDPVRLAWTLGPFLVLYGIALLSIFIFMFEAATEDRFVRGTTLFSVMHMNRLPLDWHESQGSGSKLQRIMTARNSLKQLYNIYKWSVMPFIGGVAAIIVSVITIDAPLFFLLMYAAFMGSFIVVGWHAAKPLPGLHDRHNKLLERMMARVYEFVGAVRTVKAFYMEDFIASQARFHEGEGHGAMRRVFRAISLKWTILNMVGYVWMMIFILTCIAGVYQGWLSVGGFATVFFLANQFWGKLEEIIYMQDHFLEHRNGFMRLTETLKAQPRPVDLEPSAAFPEDWRTIRFDNMNFTYTGQEGPALHDIDLKIRRGEKVAIVGRSGAGKSTFIKLLMKQMLPDSGTIRLDDTDLAHISSGEWLPRIGLVPQDVELFNMSIRDNILLDRVTAIDEAVYQTALAQSALAELIESLPERDETFVGERGIKLSGGQRQRLGVARALVRPADLIIFDEATSALDSLSEQVIQNALETAFEGRTILLIAHRLSTVRFADRILVLDEGRVIEDGSFDELIGKNGMFAKMWAMQSQGFEAQNQPA